MRKSLILVALACVVAFVVPTAAGAASSGSGGQKLLITKTDLPAGWTASTHDSTGDDVTAQAIAACMGKPIVKKKVSLTSDDVADPSAKFSASNTVAVYATPALAKKQFAAYASPKYRTCVQSYFESAPFGGTGGPLPTQVQITKIQLPSYGQSRVGYALRADIPQEDGTSLAAYSVQAAILRGRAIVKAQFNGSGDVFSQKQGEAVLKRLDTRLAKAKV
jgi:hypothetical protein